LQSEGSESFGMWQWHRSSFGKQSFGKWHFGMQQGSIFGKQSLGRWHFGLQQLLQLLQV